MSFLLTCVSITALQLEAELKEIIDETKDVFMMTREADERLQKIRERKREKQDRLRY